MLTQRVLVAIFFQVLLSATGNASGFCSAVATSWSQLRGKFFEYSPSVQTGPAWTNFNPDAKAYRAISWIGDKPVWKAFSSGYMPSFYSERYKFGKVSSLFENVRNIHLGVGRLMEDRRTDSLLYWSAHAREGEFAWVRKGNAYDRRLVERSSLDKNPHERLEYRFKSATGEVLEVLGPYVGEAHSVEVKITEVVQLLANLQSRGLNISEIESVHTHPGETILLSEDDTFSSPKMILPDLSSADFSVARMMGRLLPVRFVVTAIVGFRAEDITAMSIQLP